MIDLRTHLSICFEPISCSLDADLRWTEPDTDLVLRPPRPDWAGSALAAAKAIGCSYREIEWLFHAAGAPARPFNGSPWPVPEPWVWTNLMQISELPPRKGRQQWADVYRSVFNARLAEKGAIPGT